MILDHNNWNKTPISEPELPRFQAGQWRSSEGVPEIQVSSRGQKRTTATVNHEGSTPPLPNPSKNGISNNLFDVVRDMEMMSILKVCWIQVQHTMLDPFWFGHDLDVKSLHFL